MFVPGDRPDRFGKALSLGADRITIDLEDAVLADNKMAARDAIAAAALNWQNVIVRINPVETVHFEFDMSLLRSVPVRMVMVPKAESSDMISRVDRSLNKKCALLPQIETVKSLFALKDILHAERVDRVAFGIWISRSIWAAVLIRMLCFWPGHRSCFIRAMQTSRHPSIV